MKRFRMKMLNNTRGTAAIEFAVIAPVLVMLLFGTLEMSIATMVTNVMESATANSSRLGKTGYSASGQSRTQTIINAITARAGALINPSLLTITAKSYKQFDQIGKPEPWTDTNHDGIAQVGEYTDVNGNGQWDADMGVAGYGNANDVVVYTISYPWRITTPIIAKFFPSGIYTITTSAVVKNEPY